MADFLVVLVAIPSSQNCYKYDTINDSLKIFDNG
jgi:hypothetical protein